RLPLIACVYTLADRVLIREELSRHLFIDNRHSQGVAGIGGAEVTPAAQRDAEHSEVVRTYTDHVGYRRRLVWASGPSFYCEIVREFHAVGRQTIAYRGCARAGQAPNPVGTTRG